MLTELDVVRAQDVGLTETPDPILLDWAASENRLILTHDYETMIAFAYDRVRAELPMSGLAMVSSELPVGIAIDELAIFAECSRNREWDGQVVFFPMQ